MPPHFRPQSGGSGLPACDHPECPSGAFLCVEGRLNALAGHLCPQPIQLQCAHAVPRHWCTAARSRCNHGRDREADAGRIAAPPSPYKQGQESKQIDPSHPPVTGMLPGPLPPARHWNAAWAPPPGTRARRGGAGPAARHAAPASRRQRFNKESYCPAGLPYPCLPPAARSESALGARAGVWEQAPAVGRKWWWQARATAHTG
jgi:hypothetical protein